MKKIIIHNDFLVQERAAGLNSSHRSLHYGAENSRVATQITDLLPAH